MADDFDDQNNANDNDNEMPELEDAEGSQQQKLSHDMYPLINAYLTEHDQHLFTTIISNINDEKLDQAFAESTVMLMRDLLDSFVYDKELEDFDGNIYISQSDMTERARAVLSFHKNSLYYNMLTFLIKTAESNNSKLNPIYYVMFSILTDDNKLVNHKKLLESLTQLRSATSEELELIYRNNRGALIEDLARVQFLLNVIETNLLAENIVSNNIHEEEFDFLLGSILHHPRYLTSYLNVPTELINENLNNNMLTDYDDEEESYHDRSHTIQIEETLGTEDMLAIMDKAQTSSSDVENNDHYIYIKAEILSDQTISQELDRLYDQHHAKSSDEIHRIREQCAKELVRFALNMSNPNEGIALLNQACEHQAFTHRNPFRWVASQIRKSIFNEKYVADPSNSQKILLQGIEQLQQKTKRLIK